MHALNQSQWAVGKARWVDGVWSGELVGSAAVW